MDANEILKIVKAFFDAILKILQALGINFGDKPEEPAEEPSEPAPVLPD